MAGRVLRRWRRRRDGVTRDDRANFSERRVTLAPLVQHFLKQLVRVLVARLHLFDARDKETEQPPRLMTVTGAVVV